MRHVAFIRKMLAMGIVSLFSSARGFLLLPVLTSRLGVVQYGFYSQFVIGLQFLIPFTTLGLENAVMRYLAGVEDVEEISEGFLTALLSSLIVAGFLAGGVYWGRNCIFPFVMSEDVEPMLIDELAMWLFPLLILYAGSILVTAFFRTLEKFGWYAGLSILDSFAFFILVLIWVSRGNGLISVIWAMIFGKTLVFFIGMGGIIWKISIKLPGFRNLSKYLYYCIPLLPAIFFYYLIQFCDRYVIIQFHSIEEVARYNAAYTFGGIIALVFSPFFQLITPRVMALWNQKEFEEGGVFISKAIKYSMIPSIWLLLVVGLYSPKIMSLYASHEFVVDTPTMIMIMMAYLFIMVQSFSRNVLLLAEKTRKMLLVDGVVVLVNLILNFLFIPFIGIAGAALATLLTTGLQFLVNFLWSRSYLQYSLNGIFIIKAICSACVSVACMSWIGLSGSMTGLFLLLGSVWGYMGLIYLFGGFTKTEIKTFITALRFPFGSRIRSGIEG